MKDHCLDLGSLTLSGLIVPGSNLSGPFKIEFSSSLLVFMSLRLFPSQLSVLILCTGVSEDGLSRERTHPGTRPLFSPRDQRSRTVNPSRFCPMILPEDKIFMTLPVFFKGAVLLVAPAWRCFSLNLYMHLKRFIWAFLTGLYQMLYI